MSDNISEKESAKWYAIHTYSGYENKVKANIEKSVENRGIQHLIQKVEVLEEEVTDGEESVKTNADENADGGEQTPEKAAKSKRVTKRKLLPCYVMIKMIMTDESWYVVRNTRGVTGFVGPASKPVPISDEEVAKLRIEKAAPIDFDIGDHVSINSGQMEGFTGTIESIDAQTRKVSVRAVTFNREMLVELDVGQISHID